MWFFSFSLKDIRYFITRRRSTMKYSLPYLSSIYTSLSVYMLVSVSYPYLYVSIYMLVSMLLSISTCIHACPCDFLKSAVPPCSWRAPHQGHACCRTVSCVVRASASLSTVTLHHTWVLSLPCTIVLSPFR